MIPSYRPFYSWDEIATLWRFGSTRNEFEAAVAGRVGARFALSFSYARVGMIALFKALRLDQAEIIMPAYTCSSVAEAVVFSGNKPIFVDINLADYNMDVRQIKSAITPHTRAIIATHMFGYPIDIKAIRQELGRDDITIIEDATLALPIRYAESDAAIYSFGRGKQLYTISGGIVTTDSPDLYEKLKAYRDQTMNHRPSSVWVRRGLQIGTAYLAQNGDLEEQIVKLKNIGPVRQAREKTTGLARQEIPQDYDSAYADFQGRMGLAQLGKLNTVLERARARAQFYHQALQGIPGVTLPPLVAEATYAYYSVRIADRDVRGFSQRMQEKGIEVGRNFSYALPYLEPYRRYATGQYPNAEKVAGEVANLPNYPGLTRAEADYIVECTRQIMYENVREHA